MIYISKQNPGLKKGKGKELGVERVQSCQGFCLNHINGIKLAVSTVKIKEDTQAFLFPNKNNDGYIELTCRFFP